MTIERPKRIDVPSEERRIVDTEAIPAPQEVTPTVLVDPAPNIADTRPLTQRTAREAAEVNLQAAFETTDAGETDVQQFTKLSLGVGIGNITGDDHIKRVALHGEQLINTDDIVAVKVEGEDKITSFHGKKVARHIIVTPIKDEFRTMNDIDYSMYAQILAVKNAITKRYMSRFGRHIVVLFRERTNRLHIDILVLRSQK